MECPNCGEKIGRFELSQNCTHCGINLFYCQQEKLLSSDAKRCELEFASLRVFVTKLKTAFIGGPLQIARLVFTLVCVGMLFIPFGSLEVNIPLFSHSLSFWGYGLYSSFSDGSLLALLDFAGIDISADIAQKALMLVAAMLFLLLVDLALFVSEILSLTNIRRSARAMAVLSAVGAAGSVFAVAACFTLNGAENAFADGLVEISFGYGGFAAFAAYLVMLAINCLILKKKIAPQYKQVDLDRIQIRKRVKSGELTLEELPLPVLESEEEREQRLKEEKELAEKNTKAVTADE